MRTHEFAQLLITLPDVPLYAFDADTWQLQQVSGVTHDDETANIETDSDEEVDS